MATAATVSLAFAGYASLFLAYPSYALAEKVPFTEHGDGWTPDETERIAMTFLRKNLGAGYAIEEDLSASDKVAPGR